ncbi:replication protein [Thermaerobacillus caldiproteolyticus]|uniref:replication protein n=1 Tax=Thermaerobacillus caldiproteolyticus TaxID=247480 RepID=UPI0018F13938|nr:replication protein [Anoxybacillus caldiproteolyticus]
MANPQKENGFTAIAHEILEEVAKRKFTATQLSILMIVWRMTYGYSRKDHEMAVSLFVEATGFSKRNIQEAITELIEGKVLIETQPASFNQTRKLAFNKNYDEWQIASRTKSKQVNQSSPPEPECTSPGELEFTHKRNNKEISSSSNKEQEVFDFYQQNLQIGVCSSPYVLENIQKWIKDTSPDLVLAAMKVAAKKEKKGFDYTEGILLRWVDAGVKTIDDARRFEQQFREQKKRKAKVSVEPNPQPRINHEHLEKMRKLRSGQS